MNYIKNLLIRFLWYIFYWICYPWEFSRRLLLLLKVKQAGRNIKYQTGFDVFGGNRVFIGDNVTLTDTFINCVNSNVYLGKDSFFGHRVMLITGNHDYKLFGVSRQKGIDGRDIRVEEGVWVGSGVIILGGVCVGKHSVLAAGSVVTKDVPPYTIVAGVPAKVIKSIPNLENAN